MSQSEEELDTEAYAECLTIFKSHGSREPKIDQTTDEELFHLWKILTKCMGDHGDFIYEAQYWENDNDGNNHVYPVPATELATLVRRKRSSGRTNMGNHGN